MTRKTLDVILVNFNKKKRTSGGVIKKSLLENWNEFSFRGKPLTETFRENHVKCFQLFGSADVHFRKVKRKFLENIL